MESPGVPRTESRAAILGNVGDPGGRHYVAKDVSAMTTLTGWDQAKARHVV